MADTPGIPSETGDGIGGVPVGRASAPRPSTAAGPAGRHTPTWVIPAIVLALVAGLGIGLAIGLLMGDGGGDEAATTTAATSTSSTAPADAAAYAQVQVTGNALPRLVSGQADAAVGLTIPEASGFDYRGNPLSISLNGKAKLIVALAHWCPYCNAEMPILQEWYAGAAIPGNVEVISLSVFADPTRDNYPPGTWLDEAAWNLPLMGDDEARSLAANYGIAAVPFWLLVAEDGTVMARGTGQMEATNLDSIITALATPAETTTTAP